MPIPETRCRVHLGLVRSTEGDHWELRVSPRKGSGVIARVRLTPDQFSSLMSGELVTNAELETD